MAARAAHAADVIAWRRKVWRTVFPFQPAGDEFNVEPGEGSRVAQIVETNCV
jgi:hypothetical protein